MKSSMNEVNDKKGKEVNMKPLREVAQEIVAQELGSCLLKCKENKKASKAGVCAYDVLVKPHGSSRGKAFVTLFIR